MNWKNLYTQKAYITELIISTILLGVILYNLTRFLNFVERRVGIQINDPILTLFKPYDLTWIIFITIYISLAAGLIYLIKHPTNLLPALQTYALMVLIRMTIMYLAPFDPPKEMILLKDPLVEILGTGREMTRDLFFSGHTATLYILYLLTDKKVLRFLFLSATIAVASALLIQHVHYSIDIAAAFCFTYASYDIVKRIRKLWQKDELRKA